MYTACDLIHYVYCLWYYYPCLLSFLLQNGRISGIYCASYKLQTVYPVVGTAWCSKTFSTCAGDLAWFVFDVRWRPTNLWILWISAYSKAYVSQLFLVAGHSTEVFDCFWNLFEYIDNHNIIYLSKKLIFVIYCSFWYLYFIVAK